jgi:uncharacterized protein (DUF488 family)
MEVRYWDFGLMDEHTPTTTRRLCSIGHSNHALERFLDLLRQHRIEVLVDARSHPYSKFAPHFDTVSLKDAATRAGIKYLFMGRELGGRPDGNEFYDTEGHVLYWRVAESPLFLDGIERLENGIAKYRVALMCSEENPSACHRRLLVGRVLATRGIQIEHIRGNGSVQTEAELQAEGERHHNNGQIEFFEEPSQEKAWRSIQSVLQKGRRQSSSER